jgi:hypothetical protein
MLSNESTKASPLQRCPCTSSKNLRIPTRFLGVSVQHLWWDCRLRLYDRTCICICQPGAKSTLRAADMVYLLFSLRPSAFSPHQNSDGDQSMIGHLQIGLRTKGSGQAKISRHAPFLGSAARPPGLACILAIHLHLTLAISSVGSVWGHQLPFQVGAANLSSKTIPPFT